MVVSIYYKANESGGEINDVSDNIKLKGDK